MESIETVQNDNQSILFQKSLPYSIHIIFSVLYFPLFSINTVFYEQYRICIVDING